MKCSRRLMPVGCLLLFGAVAPSRLCAAPNDRAEKLDAFLRAYHELGRFNGAALVAQAGVVVLKQGYGMANFEWEIPNAPDTKFRLGSITKQFTAMLVMQMVEAGKLNLDDPISRHLPYYRKDTGERVTIHQLLTHTSGIPSYTDQPGFIQHESRDPYTPEAFIKEYCSGDLSFEPGSTFRYNNSGYFLLGAIIEAVATKPYATVLQEQILTPLGMTDTGYDRHDRVLPKRAAGYERLVVDVVNAPYLDMSIPYAAGSLYSTVEDLYKWDQALYTEKLLSRAGLERMFTPVIQNYAYGWGVRELPVGETDRKVKVVGHGGGINGFGTVIERVVDYKHLIVILDNTGGAPMQEMTAGIISILFDQPAKAPEAHATRAVLRELFAHGAEAGRTAYRRAVSESPGAPPVTEGAINGVGYRLLGAGRIEEALTVFRFNTELFPESFNVYDSLGEACFAAGDYPEAIRNYAKSVALHPGHAPGVEMLARIMKQATEAGVAFGRPGQTVAAEVLAKYVGQYRLESGRVLQVGVEDGQLVVQATGQPKVRMVAETASRFSAAEVGATVEFVVDGEAPAHMLNLHQHGRVMPAPRVE